MPAKTSRKREAYTLLSWLYERGEDALSQVLEELFGDDKASDRLEKTVRGAADAKRRVDRNMQFLLSLLNLPSRADYNKLLTKIEALQGNLLNINMKLDRLLAAETQRRTAMRPVPSVPRPRTRKVEEEG